MLLDWTKNLGSEQDKEDFQRRVQNSKEVLDRLSEILTEYEKSLDRSETDLKTYDVPNWDYKQAHKNGYRACLYRIKELINLDQRIIKL